MANLLKRPLCLDLLEAAAIECLRGLNSELLNRDELDGASDVLFSIYADLDGRRTANAVATYTNNDTPFEPTRNSTSIPLSSPDDEEFLSPVQCYIRSHCVEYFEATEAEGADSASKHQQQRGRRSPIVVGRVGIRCVFCKNCPFNERASQSTAFPSNLDKIYSSVVMWQCRHLPQCGEIPSKVRKQLNMLKRGHGGGVSSNGAAKNSIWASSAKDKGLIDTKDGIKFRISPINDNEQTVTASATASASTTSSTTTLVAPKPVRTHVVSPNAFLPICYQSINCEQLFRGSDLVSAQDSGPAYLKITFAQYKRTYLSDADKVGAYKSRMIGGIGLCCKWCADEPGHRGRYFPNKRESLGHTTMLQAIVKHVCSCSKCPPQFPQAISSLSDGLYRSNDGNKSKAKLIKTVWSRLHDAHLLKADNIFRPIQEPDDFDSALQYEVLEAKPMVDAKGRRVSVCVQDLDCDSSPVTKKAKVQ